MKKKLLIAASVVLLLIVVVVTAFGLYIRSWYGRLVASQPTVVPVTATQDQAAEVNRRIDRIDQALRRGETVAANFSQEEINVALSARQHLEPWRDQLKIKKIEGEVMTLEASVPLPDDSGNKRFLNCEVDLFAQVQNGKLEFEIRGARSADGKDLPPRFVTMIEEYARRTAEQDPAARREIERIEVLEVRDGQLFMRIAPRHRN